MLKRHGHDFGPNLFFPAFNVNNALVKHFNHNSSVNRFKLQMRYRAPSQFFTIYYNEHVFDFNVKNG